MAYSLNDRYTSERGVVFASGIQMLARLPLDQLRADRRHGFNTAALVSGYPGSPLGGFDNAALSAARLAPELPISCRPALNEEYAATALMGSQLASTQPDARYDGVVGLWYGKAPGVDRATDALRHGVYTGTSPHGGVVLLVGDDPAAKSSTVPSSSAGVLTDLHIPMLYPGDPAAALDLGRHAIALSRFCGLWIALKIVADVADGTASVRLDPDSFVGVLPETDLEYSREPDGRLLTPHTLDLEREIYEVRYERARQYATANRLNAVTVDTPDAWIGIVSSGITYHEVRAALSRLGLTHDDDVANAGIRLVNMRMPLPFDSATMRSAASGLTQMLVVEEKQPHIELLLKDALYSLADRPLVIGKLDAFGAMLVPGYGALDADSIVPILRRCLQDRLGSRLVPEQPERRTIPVVSETRSPYYCSGCPHNRSTEAPPNTLIGAGIGCHTMTLLMEPERVGDIVGITPMGNEGAQWIGMSDFIERDHFIQNLGDGTYFHSGQLAVTAAIAAGVNMTYKLLYNGAVAMTGGQLPQGQLPVNEVCRVLAAQGVSKILITTDEPAKYRKAELPTGIEVWNRDRVVEAQLHLATICGVTVLIHDQACAAELRRERKRGSVATPTKRIVINHRICEGCGDCGRVSNCLSVQPFDTEFGRKTQIDQSSCNFDFSCMEGDCPAFIEVDLAPRGFKTVDHSSDVTTLILDGLLLTPLPEPNVVVPRDDFAMRVTGIGGTGVVTVSQIIGTAAMLDGYTVRGLDQVGLSQKAGPVVSDIRLTRGAHEGSNRVGERECDLLLVFDQLVGASPRALATADPSRTTVVGSTSTTPTGHVVRHPETEVSSATELSATIAEFSRSDQQHWADAAAIALAVFNNEANANVIVLGMAAQAGTLPVTPESVERAITLNGATVDTNLKAFRLGRHILANAEAVDLAIVSDSHENSPVVEREPLDSKLVAIITELPSALQPAVRRFATDLVAYQSRAYALEYLQTVSQVAVSEAAIEHATTHLTESVAANLYKLLAYKDEYEVARLMFDPSGRETAVQLAGTHGSIHYQLHPPALRSLGMQRKISFGAWSNPMFRALSRAKRLRGTPFDPFGRAEVRRVERDLIVRYRAAIAQVLLSLGSNSSTEMFDVALRIATLPDLVRGYEHLKLERSAQFRTDLELALQDLAQRSS